MKVSHFHTICLRKILSIRWQKHIPDTEVLTRASIPCIYTILLQSQLRWAGHVVRMKYNRLPKKLLYGELSQASAPASKTLKFSMKSFGIAPSCEEYLGQNRNKWCEVVKRGAKICETRRNAATELCGKLRKGTVTSASAATIPCSHCPRLFHTQIGLISHLRTHECLSQSWSWSDSPHRLRWTKKRREVVRKIMPDFKINFYSWINEFVLISKNMICISKYDPRTSMHFRPSINRIIYICTIKQKIWC